MSWHKIDIDNKKWSAGELVTFQQKFIALWDNSGCPKDMTLLCDMLPKPGTEKHSTYISFYFSPISFQYAFQLISDYEGVPCEQPTIEDVAYFAGDRGLVDTLRSVSSL